MRRYVLVCVTTMTLVACGYSEEQWQAKQHDIEGLKAQLDAAKQEQAQIDQQLGDVGTLRARLHQDGVTP